MDIQQIDISLEGTDYAIISQGDDDKHAWTYQDTEVEIGDLQTALDGLSASSFTSETPSQKEKIGLTVYLDNENQRSVSIQLYRYDGISCLAVVDGKPTSLVERAAVVNLIEGVHAIVLGQYNLKRGPVLCFHAALALNWLFL